jgi:hypothetical protein
MIPTSDRPLIDATELGTVTDGGRPAVFAPGWEPTFAYGGLLPMVILCFRHADGTVASWFLDDGLERRGGSLAELTPEMRLGLMEASASLFDGLWAKIMLAPVPPPLDEREAGFFRLPEGTRAALLELYFSGFDTATRFAAVDRIDPTRPETQLADLGTRRLPLQRRHLHTLSNPGLLQDQLKPFMTDGAMLFPSPIDGRPLRSSHAVALHGTIHGYRFVEPVTSTVMFLIAGEIFFRPAGLFIPEGRLCVALQPDQIRGQMPEMFREFFARVMQHGDLLATYFARDDIRPVHVWRGVTAMHIGHVLWNDISGISRVIRDVPQAALPRFRLFDAGMQPEMYGPLDRIFPELEGLIDRDPGSFQNGVAGFYSRGESPVRSSAMTVPKDVRDRILAMVRPVDMASPASICALAREDRVPVVLFGLRVENRTIVGLEEFCDALVDQLSASLGEVVLVVDGHNSRIGEQDSYIWSHGELGAAHKPIDLERELVERMQDHSAGTRVQVVSTVGMPITESIACGLHAQALVAIWGAGLAKYRWVCNLPGLIITNHWNLSNLNDLHIYDSPAAMEAPTPVRFIAANLVEDLPDAPLMVPLGPDFIPSICNFRIDERGAMATIHAVLGDLGLTKG